MSTQTMTAVAEVDTLTTVVSYFAEGLATAIGDFIEKIGESRGDAAIQCGAMECHVEAFGSLLGMYAAALEAGRSLGTFAIGDGGPVPFSLPLYDKVPDHIKGIPLDELDPPKPKRKAKVRK